MKTFLAALLVSSLSSVALAQDFFGFGEKGLDLFQREISVFVDKNAVSPKCRCHRFTVAVDDTRLIPGGMFTTEVAIVEKRNGEVRSMRVEPLQALYRHPTTPKVSSQNIYMYDESAETEFEVVTLAKACLNPMAPECEVLESRTIGTFKVSDLAKLKSISVDELKN